MTTAPHWVEEYFAPPGPALDNESTGTMHNVVTTEGPHRRRNHRFTGAAPTITGFASGAPGRPLTIYAVNGDIVLKHENTGSLAANRIITNTAGDLTIPEGASAELVYDEQSTRWRCSFAAGGGGGGATLPIDLTTDVTGTLPVGNGGTGITSLGAGVATWLGTPSGANLAAALTTALPNTKGGTGQDSSGWTGLASVAAGVWSAAAVAAGILTFLATPSSANLKAAITDETGSGALVFADTPTLVTPNIGAATGTSLNTSGTLTCSYINAGSFVGTGTGARELFTYLTVGLNSRVALSVDGSDRLYVGVDSTGATRADLMTVSAVELDIYGSTGGSGSGRLKLNASGLFIQDAGGNHWLKLVVPDLAADRTLNVPVLTGTETLVVLDLAQTLTNKTVSGPSFTASSFLAVGTNVATTGEGRFANNTGIYWRNAANNANVAGVFVTSGDILSLGSETNAGSTYVQSGLSNVYRAPSHTLQTEAAAAIASFTASASTITGTLTVSGASLSVGTTPATAGTYRAPNNVTILAARNAADNANIVAVGIDSSDRLIYGGTGSIVNYYRSTVHQFQDASGTNTADIDANAFLTLANSSACLRIGASSWAGIGLIRVPYSASATILGAKDSIGNDYTVLSQPAANKVRVGDSVGFALDLYGTTTRMWGSGSLGLLKPNANFALYIDASGVALVSNGGTGSFGGGVDVVSVSNATTNPSSNPTGGGVLYADAGAGKWRGSGGTVTTFGPADLDGFKETSGKGHCPSCGTDFALEWANDVYGCLTVCVKCLTEELGDRPWIVRRHPKKEAA